MDMVASMMAAVSVARFPHTNLCRAAMICSRSFSTTIGRFANRPAAVPRLVARVVGDRGIRILEFMPREDADDAIVGGDDSFLAKPLGTGNRCAAGRFAAETAGPDLRFALENFLVRDFADHAVAHFQRPQAFDEIDRPIDLDGGRQRRGPSAFGIHLGIELVDRRAVGMSLVPANLLLFVQRGRACWSLPH